MNTLTEFLFPAPARRTTGAIVTWWERRRLAYNAFVGAAGLVSIGAVSLVSLMLGAGVPRGEFWIVPIVFGTAANICYLLGPLTELLIQTLWGRQVLPTGPMLYRMGLTFSVGLALLPTLLAGIALVVGTVVGLL
ncbi:MAG: hypothetical protein OEO79_02665 [Gemmatimonadota bacterium]|nr:hypothetical protein [Gemmatimonadota bacterium]